MITHKDKTQTGKIIFCASNRVGVAVIKHIVQKPYPIDTVITCHLDNPIYENEIAALSKRYKFRLIRKVSLNDKKIVEFLRKARPDIVFLAWWPEIIKAQTIQTANLGFINMHPSLLPHCRGKHPYYWSIIEGRPFGVSMHFIDQNIDTGPVIFQKEIPYDITDTGETLYERSIKAMISLFKSSYPDIAKLKLVPKPQNDKKASFHLRNELDLHSEIQLNKTYKAKDLIDIIRARTFNKSSSAFFNLNGEKYYLKIKIVPSKLIKS